MKKNIIIVIALCLIFLFLGANNAWAKNNFNKKEYINMGDFVGEFIEMADSYTPNANDFSSYFADDIDIYTGDWCRCLGRNNHDDCDWSKLNFWYHCSNDIFCINIMNLFYSFPYYVSSEYLFLESNHQLIICYNWVDFEYRRPNTVIFQFNIDEMDGVFLINRLIIRTK